MTVVDHETTTPTLSAAMREGSMSQHDAAENSGFMTDLMGGKLNEQAYVDYLLRLRPIYAALEETGRALADDPAVAKVHDLALERLAAIDADIEHWSPGAEPVESPAAAAYVARVRATRDWAPGYVAHHYTRYLGDLSGGQAIGRILDRIYDLDGAGTAFYRFESIEKPKIYKDGYRAALDSIDLDEADRERLVEEVKVAFNLNQGLFEELGAHRDAYLR